MTYSKTTWENRVPPRINATNLNKMETGIDEAHADIADLTAISVIDLISGVTPTFSGWDVDPTDAADITDGDIATFCTTGNKVTAGGYQYAYFEWDLGGFEHVILGGLMRASVTAGTVVVYSFFWNGSAWIQGCRHSSSSTFYHAAPCEALCSKVRVGISSTVAATVTPNIREVNCWRVV